MKSRPDPGEYAPYYEKYVGLVPEADIVSTLNSTIENTLSILGGLTEETGHESLCRREMDH